MRRTVQIDLALSSLCFLTITSCSAGGIQRAELAAVNSISKFETLVIRISNLDGVTHLGDRVNSYWLLGQDGWSRTASYENAISLEAVCRNENIPLDQVRILQGQLKDLGVIQCSITDSSTSFLLHRPSNRLRGGPTLTLVNSNRSPKEGNNVCKEIKPDWWIVIND